MSNPMPAQTNTIAQKKYGAILADPPWPYEFPNTRSDNNKDDYPRMNIDDICSLRVQTLSADDCVLFIWVRWPSIKDAFRVIESWGFDYKTLAFDWVKTRKALTLHFGMGMWTRSNSEPCLLATRGNPKRIDASVSQIIWQWENFESEPIIAKFRGHSVKPDEQYKRIEALVDGPYLEMFCRRPREGWDSWGNEIESDIQIPMRTDV